MKARPILAAAACMTLLAATACDLEVVDQRIDLRYDAPSDTLDLLLVYRGVTAADENPGTIAKAMEAARRILGGRREFMVLDWPFYYDLDDSSDAASTSGPWREIRAGITMEETGAFLDERGRLSGYQHLRIRRASRILDQINRIINRSILEETAKDDLEKQLPLLDAPTRARWVAAARAKHRWVRLLPEGIEADVPMSPAAAAALLRQAGREIAGGEGDATWIHANLAAQVTRVELEDGVLRVRFGEARRHRGADFLRFVLHHPGVRYGSGLLGALEGAGESTERLEDVVLVEGAKGDGLRVERVRP